MYIYTTKIKIIIKNIGKQKYVINVICIMFEFISTYICIYMYLRVQEFDVCISLNVNNRNRERSYK